MKAITKSKSLASPIAQATASLAKHLLFFSPPVDYLTIGQFQILIRHDNGMTIKIIEIT